MTENQVEKKPSDKFYNYLGESAILIAIISAVIFFIGLRYYGTFFDRLAVPYKFLGFSVVDYMIAAIIPIIGLSLLYSIVFSVWSHAPKNRMEAFVGNLVLFIPLALTIIVYNLFVKNYLIKSIITISFVLAILYYIYLSYQKYSSAYSLYLGNTNLFLFLILITGSFIMIADVVGNHNAEQLIQGKSGSEIQLLLEDNTMNLQLQNKTLILVMLYDNKYFVIEKNESITVDPKLYIIQNDKIKMAIIYKVTP